ncbi:MAG: molybdopterin-dependent oxidoreductase Mo/Fe-S-binding subunit, partial [gamma proteobacterium symbiont of Clathrolucina costata]
MKITFTLNGKRVGFKAAAGESAQKFLQRHGIPSVRNSDDGFGFAGSDSILLDGRVVCAGLMLAPQLEGREVRTVESLRNGRSLGIVQQAMLECGCIQSGYNAPAAALMIYELLQRCPKPTREEIIDALSGLFNRATGYRQFFDAVELASKRMENPDAAPLYIPEFAEQYSVVGKRLPKKDAARMVAGEKMFVEDRVENDACHLKVLRSPHAHALIKSIDISKAEALPGVVGVFTYGDVPRKTYTQAGQGFPEPSPYDRMVLSWKARHVGDRIAAVVAESPEIAEAAVNLIAVKYERLPVILDWDDAIAAKNTLIHNGRIVYETGVPADLVTLNRETDPDEEPVLYQVPI